MGMLTYMEKTIFNGKGSSDRVDGKEVKEEAVDTENWKSRIGLVCAACGP